MGLDIIPQGVAFTDYIDITSYPVTDSLAALFYLGKDAATSTKNMAGGSDAVAGANVAYAAGYATFSGDPTAAANFIQTAESDGASTDFTRVALFQRMDATDRPVFGLFGGANSGSGLLQSQSYYATGVALVTKSLGQTAAAATSFLFAAQTYVGGSSPTLTTYIGSGGVLTPLGAVTGAARVAHAVAERIGGSVSTAAYSGTSRIAMVAKHRAALTADQIALVYAFTGFEAARRGIVVA